MTPTHDHLMVQVPRLVEDEPGFRTSALLADLDKAVSKSVGGVTGAEVTALLEPVSKRWLGAPKSVAFASAPADWTATGTTLVQVAPPALQGAAPDVLSGVASTTEAEWSAVTVEDLQALRGFVLSLYIYQPADWAEASRTVAVEVAGKWRLELTPNETGGGMGWLFEAEEDTALGWGDTPWPVSLIGKEFYNTLHRIWFQPLAGAEFLVRNADDPLLGQVIRTKRPVQYQPTPEEAGYTVPPGADPAEMDPPPPVDAPWDAGTLTVRGYSRAFFVASYQCFPASWEIASTAPKQLGYETEQVPTVDLRSYLPATGLENGPYAATLTVTTPSGDTFGSAPEGAFVWSVAVAGPADVSLGADPGVGYSFRAVVLDRLSIIWPTTLLTDGASEFDLAVVPDVFVNSMSEQRTLDDSQATLTVEVTGQHAVIEPYCRPNARWQWVVQGTGEEADHIRFDGLRDTCSYRKWTERGGTYYATATVTLRNRWRQLDRSVYRGSVPLDGLTRSEVYQTLAEMVPLDATEIEVGTLAHDEALPTTPMGDRPALLPRIGSDIGSVVRDVQRMFGLGDRVRFLEDVLSVEPEDHDTCKAVFYRLQSTLTAAVAPVGSVKLLLGAESKPAVFVETTDDLTYINDLWVIGRDDGSLPERPSPYVWHMSDEDSWQDPIYELYIGQRRTAVVQHPELVGREAVDKYGRDTWEKFHRFTYQASLSSWLSPELYPDDAVAVDPGAEPGGVLVLAQIVGMTTSLISWALPWEERWRTVYELRLLQDTWTPPEEA